MPKTEQNYFEIYLAAITGLSSRTDLNPWDIPRMAHQIADTAITEWRSHHPADNA